MRVEEFLGLIQQNVNRVKEYELGHDGTGGKCDCIGLIIGALRLGGEKWTSIHGSNYAARNKMNTLNAIESKTDLCLGYLVYKAKMEDQSGYALPDRYKDDPDQHDYYHVGVVTGVDPLEITHCTSVDGGIKIDTSVGKWTHYGELKGVDYAAAEDTQDMITCTVTGGKLALRKGAGKDHKVILYIPDGATVQAAESGVEGWSYVRYDGKGGFSMTKYLKPEALPDAVTLELDRETAEKLLKALQGVMTDA